MVSSKLVISEESSLLIWVTNCRANERRSGNGTDADPVEARLRAAAAREREARTFDYPRHFRRGMDERSKRIPTPTAERIL
jgi:hypothetical protein